MAILKTIHEEVEHERLRHGAFHLVTRYFPNSREYEVSLYKGTVNDLNLKQRFYCQTYKQARLCMNKFRRMVENS